MVNLVYLIGAMIAVGGVLLLVRPALMIGLIESGAGRPWLYTFAIIVRVVLGVLLVTGAAQSRYPLVVEILGWLVLAAALVLLLMGSKRFYRLIRWIMQKVRPFAPIGGLIGVLFGVFLICAFTV